jgi:hypothetical protein
MSFRSSSMRTTSFKVLRVGPVVGDIDDAALFHKPAVNGSIETLRLVRGGDEQAVPFAADDFIEDDIGRVDQGSLLTGHAGVTSGGFSESTVGLFDMPDGCFPRIAQGFFKIIAGFTGQGGLKIIGVTMA